MADSQREMSEAIAACIAHVGGRDRGDPEVIALAGELAAGKPVDPARCDRLGCGAECLALVAFDFPGIQGHILDTNKRPIVAATSRLIRDACARVPAEVKGKTDLPEECVIFSAGGQGLALVPTALSEQVRAAIETAFDPLRSLARPVIASVAIHPAELSRAPEQARGELLAVLGLSELVKRPFALLRQRLAARIEAGREVSGQAPVSGERCGLCRIRSIDEAITIGAERFQVCEACAMRWRARPGGDTERTDFSDIERTRPGRRVRREKHIAVLYADGNGIGSVLEDLGTITQYRAFSRALDWAVTRGRALALEELGVERRVTLMAGGDDLLLLVPGPLAMALAARVCERVEAVFTPEARIDDAELARCHEDLWTSVDRKSPVGARVGRVGLAVGVVFAEASFPLRLMMRYAKEVLKSAKRRAHRDQVRSVVDFICVGTGAHVGTAVAEDRARRLVRGDRSLVERPYSLEELQVVLHEVAALQALPRSQVYAARGLLVEERELGRLHMEYQVARSREWQRFCQEIARLHASRPCFVPELGRGPGGELMTGIGLASWRRSARREDGILATPMLDWMELMDHVDPSAGARP